MYIVVTSYVFKNAGLHLLKQNIQRNTEIIQGNKRHYILAWIKSKSSSVQVL